ncbi:MAG: hypothetical protein JSS82_18440 [Bacteroidetes bacterium]|nr:hypothetical protein [Bacteroidota bacterium]
MDLDFSALAAEKTDAELTDIYLFPKKYQDGFFEAAKAELQRRGVDLAPLDESKRLKAAKETPPLVHEERGERMHLFIFFLLAFLGGLIGIVAGHHYGYSKRNGLNGERYYEFDKDTRTFGRIIFFTGIAALIVAVRFKTRLINLLTATS